MVQFKSFSGGILCSAAMVLVVACGQANTETADSSGQSVEQPCKQKAGAAKKKQSPHARWARHGRPGHHRGWHGRGNPPPEEPPDVGAAGTPAAGVAGAESETEPPSEEPADAGTTTGTPGTGGAVGTGGAGALADDDDDNDSSQGDPNNGNESTGGSATGGTASAMGGAGAVGGENYGGGYPYEPSICGNGWPEGMESCDDGNAEPDDGCSADCQLEPGWVCPEFGMPCQQVVCGDGQTNGYEECDDGNTVDGDGCSSQCTPEVGYTCPAPGEPCRMVACGDGMQDSYVFSVGASSNPPAPEDGGTATGGAQGMGGSTGSSGTVWSYERCDDGNQADGDGCSSTCGIEPGYNCETSGEPCRQIVCGDGLQDWYATAPSTEQTPEDPYGYTPGANELCDDGNQADDDGCSAECIPEPNFICEMPGQPCKPAVCGDGAQDWYVTQVIDTPQSGGYGGAGGASSGTGGDWAATGGAAGGVTTDTVQILYGYEQCDDGNAAESDGCSSTCSVEPGYSCEMPGTPCKLAVCGDSIVDSYYDMGPVSEDADAGMEATGGRGGMGEGQYGWEDCDDGNAVSDDGCSAACKLETGYVCDAPGQTCRKPTCGDGFQDYYGVVVTNSVETGSGDATSVGTTWTEWIWENCDDGNAVGGDGCSATCEVEVGYACSQPGQPCRQPVCGDGFQDGYQIAVPGSGGTPEPNEPGTGGTPSYDAGAATGGSPSDNGLYVWEACDDGNATDGDGCSATCEVESGWSCQTAGQPCIVPVCGDGYQEYPAEECDDGNTLSGDGCSATCTYEY